MKNFGDKGEGGGGGGGKKAAMDKEVPSVDDPLRYMLAIVYENLNKFRG